MIETERLILRPWRSSDLGDVMAATNTPSVMEYLDGVQDEAHFRAMIERQIAYAGDHGFCFWPVTRKKDGAFLGFCGLKRGAVAPVLEEIEIGWRFGREFWGEGYAHEAAEAVLAWAWAHLDCEVIFAITAAGNQRSRRLMERLGMRRRTDLDFHHPAFAPEHRLAPHVTYETLRP